MGRGMLLAVSAAAVIGSVGGGLAALHSAPESAGPAPLKPGDPLDPKTRLGAIVSEQQMKTVLGRFAAWSRDHAGAPCPDGALLGGVVLDPWGHPIELTCTDQPADQLVGAVSAGPDGIMGSGDDVASWGLGRDVTDLVRGPRWRATPAAPTRRRPARDRGRAR